MARPKKKIDYELVAKLAKIQCTQDEIASILDVCRQTLAKDEQFINVYKKHIDEGKMSLRRLQWKAAEEGNATMMVWLGKQYIGQRDKFDNENKTSGEITVTIKEV